MCLGTFAFITRIVPNWISNVEIVIRGQGVIIVQTTGHGIEGLDENEFLNETSKQDDKTLEKKPNQRLKPLT